MAMSRPKSAVALALAMGLGTGGAAQATLSDLADGTVFDDVLKVMWLQNANLAASETFGVAGAGSYMDWLTAKEWIAAMNAANYLGYRDWRLPDVSPVDEVAFDYTDVKDGSTDYGFNISADYSAYPSSTASEMAFMFYQNLRNIGRYEVDGTPRTGDPGFDGLVNTGPFDNLLSAIYWAGVPCTSPQSGAFFFFFQNGSQGCADMGGHVSVWPVRDAPDFTPAPPVVPLPPALWLLGAGFLGYLGLGRRGRNEAAA